MSLPELEAFLAKINKAAQQEQQQRDEPDEGQREHYG
jgi:hypothetical protein